MFIAMKAIFVFAHPDDESFSSSGTIARLTKEGVDVKLITATRGEEGMSGEYDVSSKKELGEIREKELRNAAKILGISKIYFLNYFDFTLNKIPLLELVDKVLSIIKKEKPDIVVTFNKEGSSRHPDHITISRAATEAFTQYLKVAKKRTSFYHNAVPQSFLNKLKKEGLAYNAFGEIEGDPDDEITTVVDVSRVIDKKISAIKCHQTQKKDWERFLKRSKHKEFTFEFFKLIKQNHLV